MLWRPPAQLVKIRCENYARLVLLAHMCTEHIHLTGVNDEQAIYISVRHQLLGVHHSLMAVVKLILARR